MITFGTLKMACSLRFWNHFSLQPFNLPCFGQFWKFIINGNFRQIGILDYISIIQYKEIEYIS